MTFRVVTCRRARQGIAEGFRWIAERSPAAAMRWLDGMERAIKSLEAFPTRCGLAPESEHAAVEVRQQFYGRRANKYRILFVVRGDVVYVIEVRHGARRRLGPRELELPPEPPEE